MSLLPAFTILGEVPNGGPGPDTAPALRKAIPPEQMGAVLHTARDLILTATGPRDGVASTIDVRRFDQAIRVYMPLGHYERSPNQAISVMDYKMYACRVVHRLLNQLAGKRIEVAGAYSSHLATNARANAIYEALKDFEQGTTATPTPAAARVSSYLGRDTSDRLSTRPPPSAVVTLPPLPHFTLANGRRVNGPLAVAAHVAAFGLAVFEKNATLPLPLTTFDPEIHAAGKSPTAQRRAERAGAHAETHLLAAGFTGRLSGNWSSGEMVRVRARSILAAVESLASGAPHITPTQPATAPATPPSTAVSTGTIPGPPTRSKDQAERAARAEIEERVRREVQAAERRAREEAERALRAEFEERLRAERARTLNTQPSGSDETARSPAVERPAWADSLADVGARNVFLHLAMHGSVTESEAVEMLGSARALRRFSMEFELHARNVPFRVRVEPAADGSKRYVKEGEI